MPVSMPGQQRPRLFPVENRSLAFLLRIFRPPQRVRRVGVEDMTDHQPVKEHAQRRQVLLYRSLGKPLPLRLGQAQHFYIGGDVRRLHLRQVERLFHLGEKRRG